MTATAVLVVAIVLMLVGVAGTVIPLLPGIPIIFVAIAAYGWYEGFQVINAQYLVILAGLTVLSIFVDYLSSTMGASYFGSSKYGVWGAFLGTLIGLFVFPPLGIFIGPWLGAALGEYAAKKDWSQAFKAGIGTVIGLFSGIVVNLILALVMFVSFLVKVF